MNTGFHTPRPSIVSLSLSLSPSPLLSPFNLLRSSFYSIPCPLIYMFLSVVLHHSHTLHICLSSLLLHHSSRILYMPHVIIHYSVGIVWQVVYQSDTKLTLLPHPLHQTCLPAVRLFTSMYRLETTANSDEFVRRPYLHLNNLHSKLRHAQRNCDGYGTWEFHGGIHHRIHISPDTPGAFYDDAESVHFTSATTSKRVAYIAP